MSAEHAARAFLEKEEDGNAADFVTIGDLKMVARAYLSLLSRVETAREDAIEECAKVATDAAAKFRREQHSWKGPLNKESRDVCSWMHDGAKRVETDIRALSARIKTEDRP